MAGIYYYEGKKKPEMDILALAKWEKRIGTLGA